VVKKAINDRFKKENAIRNCGIIIVIIIIIIIIIITTNFRA